MTISASSRRHLGVISATSRRHLGVISAISRRHLGVISAPSRRHLGVISASSRRDLAGDRPRASVRPDARRVSSPHRAARAVRQGDDDPNEHPNDALITSAQCARRTHTQLYHRPRRARARHVARPPTRRARRSTRTSSRVTATLGCSRRRPTTPPERNKSSSPEHEISEHRGCWRRADGGAMTT